MVSLVIDWRMRRVVQPVMSLAVPVSCFLVRMVSCSGSMMIGIELGGGWGSGLADLGLG